MSLKTIARAAALTLGLVACGPQYDRTEITAVQPSVLGGEVGVHRISVHEGMLVKAHVVVWNDDNVQMPLQIVADDPSVVEVAGVINDRDYAFIGRRQGRTLVRLVADGTTVLSIAADVLAQPSLP